MLFLDVVRFLLALVVAVKGQESCSSLQPPGYWIPAGIEISPTCSQCGGTPTDISRIGGLCCQPTPRDDCTSLSSPHNFWIVEGTIDSLTCSQCGGTPANTSIHVLGGQCCQSNPHDRCSSLSPSGFWIEGGTNDPPNGSVRGGTPTSISQKYCLSLLPPGFWIGAGTRFASTCSECGGTSTDIADDGGQCCTPNPRRSCSSLSPPGFWIGTAFPGASNCSEHDGTPTGITDEGGQCCQPNPQNGCTDSASQCADNAFHCLTSSFVQGRCKKTCNLCDNGSQPVKCVNGNSSDDLTCTCDFGWRGIVCDIEQAQASGVECPRQNGYFKHEDPTNCEEFYYCSNGISTLNKCPEGLFFNEVTSVCDWASNAFRQGCVENNDCGGGWAGSAALNHVCNTCRTCTNARTYATNRRNDDPEKTIFLGTDIKYESINYLNPETNKHVKACKIKNKVLTWKCQFDTTTNTYTSCNPPNGQRCTGILKADHTGHLYKDTTVCS